jgi:hypothetical protein
VYQNCSFGEKVMPFYDRKNHRLKNYDYGRYGYYYVTICTNHRSLQGLIKDFKSVTTRQYKAMFQVNESLWQESYYDEVIRSQEKYHEIWNYIEHNPAHWIMKENH